MARGPEDIFEVEVLLASRISLDRERVVEDPAWAAIADNFDLSDPEQVDKALYLYLQQYIQRQQLFGGQVVFMPATNGPADIRLVRMDNTSMEEGNGNSTIAADAGSGSS